MRNLFIVLLIFISMSLSAEAIFVNSGEIIEGKIISETNQGMNIKSNKVIQTIPRKNIIRILYNTDYKNKMYLAMLDNHNLEGYIVEEDADKYILREVLKNKLEKSVRKKEVKYLSQVKIVEGVTDRIPEGIYFSFAMANAFTSDFKDRYKIFYGGNGGYLLPFNKFYSLNIAASYSRSNNNLVSMSMGACGAGIKAGVPVYGMLYPYLSLVLNGWWLNEASTTLKSNFFATGSTISAGMNIMFFNNWGMFVEYGVDLIWTFDKKYTPAHSGVLHAGILYNFFN